MTRRKKQTQPELTLSMVEATALMKLAEKQVKTLKEDDKTITPGGYPFNFNVKCDGTLSRGGDTNVSPSFKMSDLLKAVILRYAMEEDRPIEWLDSILNNEGVLGAILTMGSNTVLKTIPHELIAVWDSAEAAAKDKHKKTAKKVPRAGNTSTIGSLERTISIDSMPGADD